MSFSSVSFILFMIAVFLIYWGIPHKFRYIFIILADLVFYGSFGVKFIPLLLVQAVLTYFLALLYEKESFKKKPYLVIGVILILASLLVFKYLQFSLYAVKKVLSIISIPVSEHTIKLIAPVGISFYTFEALSYIVDVYTGKAKAQRSFLKVFAYLSFFPNITSGPIERAEKFYSMLSEERQFDYNRSVYGLRLVLLGMLKKICGADVLKQYVDAVFGNIYAYRGPVFIIAIVLYTYEIYLDFSGYTDMARGFAYLLGFELTENFRAPYLARGIKEFFGRWHISLSTWLKDYIYIPLGGSRCSKTKKYRNLMVTFLVSGIWHGASFTFIVWGLLHGIYQCIWDFFFVGKKKESGSRAGAIKVIVTFILVSFAWMFFRANSLSDAKYICLNMFLGNNFYGQMLQMGFLSVGAYVSVIAIIVATIIYDFASEKMDVIEGFSRLKEPVRIVLYVILGTLVVVLRSHNGAGADFIYFRF